MLYIFRNYIYIYIYILLYISYLYIIISISVMMSYYQQIKDVNEYITIYLTLLIVTIIT